MPENIGKMGQLEKKEIRKIGRMFYSAHRHAYFVFC